MDEKVYGICRRVERKGEGNGIKMELKRILG